MNKLNIPNINDMARPLEVVATSRQVSQSQTAPAIEKESASAPAPIPIGSDSASKSQQLMSAADEAAAKWKQRVGAAKFTWDKLTLDELFRSEGNELKLADLVQRRYKVNGGEADRQVRNFLAKRKV